MIDADHGDDAEIGLERGAVVSVSARSAPVPPDPESMLRAMFSWRGDFHLAPRVVATLACPIPVERVLALCESR